MNPIVYQANPALMPTLDTYMHSELRKLTQIDDPYAKINNIIPYETWVATKEGRLHMQLMVRYVLPAANLNAKETNRIQKALQTQGRGTKGRPRKYDARLRDLTVNRQLRIYILDCLIAKALHVDTSEWEPPIVVDNDNKPSEPRDAYDSLCRFEEWSNFRLPRAAWLLYTRTERLALSKQYGHFEKEEDGGISFDAYRAMQTAGAVVPLNIAA